MVRVTRTFFGEQWPTRIRDLNRESIKGVRLQENEIWQHCLSYVERFATDIRTVEAFGLPLVEAEYVAGLVEMFPIVQDWITWSAEIQPGPSLWAIGGAPGLLALRVLATWGAKAAEIISPDVVATLLTHPLTTTESGGQTATLALVDRRDFFWPEGLFRRADLAVQYLSEES
jgi:hypothetical protein